MAARQEYNILLESGDLLDMFPHLTGEWNRDKTAFTRAYNDHQRLLRDINVEFDTEYGLEEGNWATD